MPKNVEDLGKLIVARGFKNLPKVQSGHTGCSHGYGNTFTKSFAYGIIHFECLLV